MDSGAARSIVQPLSLSVA